MADRFNTIAGWTLFSGIVALGLGSISGHYFRANKENRPDPMGHEIEGVVEEGTAAVAGPPLEALLATADIVKGEASFRKCMSCHNAEQGGANGTGPNLYGVMGEAVGQARGGYAFSEALKAKGGKWDWATMNAWLTNPSAMASGTKMSFAGLTDPQERANVMVFLNSKGSNLPLPAVPEAPAAEAGAEPAADAAPASEAPKGK